MEVNETVVETQTTDAGKTPEPSQDKRTPQEIAAYNLKKRADEAIAAGLDPAQVLGVKIHIETKVEDEDSKPVTVGMLRDIQKSDAKKTALQMADELTDEDTKKAVKDYLEKRIVPSGDAEADFRFALGAASASKNAQVVEEINRFIVPKKTAAGGSAPAHVEQEFVPTAEEQYHMKNFGLTKEKILAARRASANKGN